MKRGWDELRAIVDRMLTMVGNPGVCACTEGEAFHVHLGGDYITFDAAAGAVGTALERLASAIEARIALERAQAMLAAAGCEGELLPLWLVTGSSVLAAWLGWSHTEKVFRRRLALSDAPGMAPVFGMLDRPKRRSLGQPAAKIRVRGGLAIAERIELPGRPRSMASFAQEAWVRVEGNPLPETVLMALADAPGRNDRQSAADVADHAFFAAADLKLCAIRNEDDAVVLVVESSWGPLAPVPKAAWDAVPHDASPICPWRAAASEVEALYALVDSGRHFCDRG